jgi:octaprenyl-diphosphate synthase
VDIRPLFPKTPATAPQAENALRTDTTHGVLRIADLYAPILDELAECRRVFADELASDQGFICDLCAHISQFHGKLLRPALLLLTARACGDLRPAHPVLAAVVEMVHIATLVHDDILDEADIRRRAATVNRLWGNERAVLMGDFLISHAYHLCSSVDSIYAARLIGRTTNTLCEGEMMQVANRENFDLTESEYLDIISRKTASLIGTCCELGASFSGAAENTVAALRRFGISVGIAFQIVDDILDLTGDEAEMGKSLGRDVHKGKLTLPLIAALRSATGPERDKLLTLLTGSDPQRHRQITRLLRERDAVDYAFSVAEDYVESARAALAALPASPAKESLSAMAEFILARRE